MVRIDDMGKKINELEESINQLLKEAEMDPGAAPNPKDAK